jgi:hypothetical protein
MPFISQGQPNGRPTPECYHGIAGFRSLGPTGRCCACQTSARKPRGHCHIEQIEVVIDREKGLHGATSFRDEKEGAYAPSSCVGCSDFGLSGNLKSLAVSGDDIANVNVGLWR